MNTLRLRVQLPQQSTLTNSQWFFQIAFLRGPNLSPGVILSADPFVNSANDSRKDSELTMQSFEWTQGPTLGPSLECETKIEEEPNKKLGVCPMGRTPFFFFEIRFFFVFLCIFRVPRYMQQITVQSRLRTRPTPASGQLCHVLLFSWICYFLLFFVIFCYFFGITKITKK